MTTTPTTTGTTRATGTKKATTKASAATTHGTPVTLPGDVVEFRFNVYRRWDLPVSVGIAGPCGRSGSRPSA